ncbi:hypothetical protein QBC34DRAFT_385018 [Podospora aff. communis PSN243]|uniref:Uncharacterized protein n=1 Tax=Podospora aff. communis PSN243 TaxID=3040156 RepID=A0AAV9G944_9PEZI|nr:hypothetical protein QBC34DRAFT_385018 [Podospora aff. communis PSN243]
MSPDSPGPQRGREEEEEEEPKRRRPDHGEDDLRKNKKPGRPSNKSKFGPPRRHPGSEVPIVPRPSLGHLKPEKTESVPAVMECGNFDDAFKFSQPAVVTNTPPLVSDTPSPLEEAINPFHDVFAMPVPLSPGAAVPSRSQSRHRDRGHQSITLDKLDPTEKALRITVVGARCHLNFDNAIASPRYTQTFVNPKFATSMGLELKDLPIDEIKRISTPRGWLRCTRSVCFAFFFPLLGDDFLQVRALVLNDDDPDIGVPLVIGRPWIQGHELLKKYVYDTAEPASNAWYNTIAF